jgi:heptosyltransferase-2
MWIEPLRWVDKYAFGMLTLMLGPPVKAFASKREPPKVGKVLVIRLWALGDAILTLPLIRGIRDRHPGARIDVLCHKAVRAVFDASGDVDCIIELRIGNLPGLFRKYDACFDTEPFLNLSALIAAFSARWRVGFRNRLRWFFFSRTVSGEPDSHLVEKYLEMGRYLGADGDRKLVPLRCAEGPEKTVEAVLASGGITGGHLLVGFCASVGASVKAREWPKENFRELAARILGAEGNVRIILTGTGEDFALNEYIRDGDPRIVNLSGKIGLPELFCLAARMDAFVSNDTGPMHVAAAQGVRTLGLFGPNTPTLYRPYGERNAFIYHGEGVCCLIPCNAPQKGLVRDCLLKGEEEGICIRSITVDEVYGKYREMTGRARQGKSAEP